MSQQIITATGAGTWTIPAGVTTITIEMWGGGGGGSAASYNYNAGGGAAYVIQTNLTVTPGDTISYNVAVGGNGGTSAGGAGTGGAGYKTGGNGSVSTGGGGGGGGSTYVTDTTSGAWTYIAAGGGGGSACSSSTTTCQGHGASGTSGGAGGSSLVNGGYGAGGGGGAGTNGGNASGSTPGAAGTGATACTGTNGDGYWNYGGGGSSAGASGNGASATGNNGAAGSGGAAGGTSTTHTGAAGTGSDSGGGGYGSGGSIGYAGGQPGAGGASVNPGNNAGKGGNGKLIIDNAMANTIIVNGFPKTGTHAVVRSLELLGQADRTTLVHQPYPYSFPVDSKHLCIFRHPRNCLISWCRFFVEGLCGGEVSTARMIDTLSNPFSDFRKYALYLQWLTDPKTLCIQYENLIVSDSGIRAIADYIQVPFVDGAFQNLLSPIVAWKSSSSTIQNTLTDTPSCWQNHWNDELDAAWKLHGMLAIERELGY